MLLCNCYIDNIRKVVWPLCFPDTGVAPLLFIAKVNPFGYMNRLCSNGISAGIEIILVSIACVGAILLMYINLVV